MSGGSRPPNASEVKETERLSVRRAHDKKVHLKLQGQQQLLPLHATALAPGDKHPLHLRPLFTCRRRQLRQRPEMSQREEDDTSTFSRITESDPPTNPRIRIILCGNVRVVVGVQGRSYVVARQKASNFHTAEGSMLSHVFVD